MDIRRMKDGTYFYCEGNEILKKANKEDILFEILENIKALREYYG